MILIIGYNDDGNKNNSDGGNNTNNLTLQTSWIFTFFVDGKFTVGWFSEFPVTESEESSF